MCSNGISVTSNLQLCNPLEFPDWDIRLSAEGQVGIFHSAAWARVLIESYGFRPLYLAIGDCGSRRIIPLMEVSSWITGKRGVSLPFTDECSPGLSAGELAQFWEKALNLGRERNWEYLELRGCPGLGSADSSAQPSLSFFSHSLALLPNSDQLFSNFGSSVRRAIRHAEKSHIEVDVSQGAEAIRAFYRLHCITRRKHGIPPQPLRFFLNIGKHILSKDLGVVISAKYNKQIIASAIFFQFGKKAVYKFGASDPRFLDLRPNNLVMWKAIQYYAQKGISTLDFGRTSLTNDGLRRFKLGWGATERVIDYFKYNFRQEAFVRGRDESSGWHNNVFRTLPRFALRWSGALLYKHIA
jgi:hypothetical protein